MSRIWYLHVQRGLLVSITGLPLNKSAVNQMVGDQYYMAGIPALHYQTPTVFFVGYVRACMNLYCRAHSGSYGSLRETKKCCQSKGCEWWSWLDLEYIIYCQPLDSWMVHCLYLRRSTVNHSGNHRALPEMYGNGRSASCSGPFVFVWILTAGDVWEW